jgi:hypothetical protein
LLNGNVHRGAREAPAGTRSAHPRRLAVQSGVAFVLQGGGVPTSCGPVADVAIDGAEGLEAGVLGVPNQVEFLNMMVDLDLNVGPRDPLCRGKAEQVLVKGNPGVHAVSHKAGEEAAGSPGVDQFRIIPPCPTEEIGNCLDGVLENPSVQLKKSLDPFDQGHSALDST